MRKAPSVLIELSVANAFVSQLFDRELERTGVRTAHVGLLWIVAAVGPATPSELELATGLPPSTLRERIATLQASGLVARRPNPSDGRSHFLEVTRDGASFLRRADRAIRKLETELGARLDRPVEAYRGALAELRAAARELLVDRGALETESNATDVLFR
jgi:DNA-binding MarR family transcriptional regulator